MFLGRWFAGLRIAAAWLAGVHRMHWPSFLFWNATGGIAWALSIGLLAYALGESAEKSSLAGSAAGLVVWRASAWSYCAGGGAAGRWSRTRSSRPRSTPSA